jgi:hypothetical protein
MSLVLLVIAVLLFIIGGLGAAGVFGVPHLLAWLFFGLAAFAAAHLPLPNVGR